MNAKCLWPAVLALSCPLLHADDAFSVRDLLPQQAQAGAHPVADLYELTRSGVLRNGRPEELATNEDQSSRGFSEQVYPRVAPAVVVVGSHYGHGTGFFIREDGWLLTNNHVVEDCDYDPELGGQVAKVNIGTLNADGWMQVVDRPLRALVYKTDFRQDLALLKLLEFPPGMDKVPVVPFAKSIPGPGAGVVAVGHPAAGTLWTLRSGEMAGVGVFPDDEIDRIMLLLRISSSDRSVFEKSLELDPERKQVVLSTCGMNPGDSGGPLVNERGELVAVTYAIPTIDLASSVDYGKFSFHIHLKEVDDFLSLWPDEPMVAAPNTRAGGTYSILSDADGDGRYDTMAITNDPEGEPIGVLRDLDQDSFDMTIEEMATAGINPNHNAFDYEFSVCAYPHVRIAYDTDNDGHVDLVYSDEDHDDQPELTLRYVDREWTMEAGTGELVSADHFKDPELRSRFNGGKGAEPADGIRSRKLP